MMKTKVLLASSLAALAVAGCGTYRTTVADPWVGSSEQELTKAWGYPTSSNDLVQVNTSTKVYTYRSFVMMGTAAGGGPTACRVSFTLSDQVVSRVDVNGADCPRIKRAQIPPKL
jgi:hypothetical protein